jgi:hypothetical protein
MNYENLVMFVAARLILGLRDGVAAVHTTRSAEMSRDLQVGDGVTTDYSGRVTHHRVRARCDDRSQGHSQTGIMVQVEPPVHKSSGPNAWIDVAWFSRELPVDQGELFA